ncbi:hypothetical protein ANCDUO_06146 [Ancylostoma duodenale]|uniref:Pre-SET domain-containing protein n=1 Tax=Ancylostoma duodenale TaxID=51022 RepID=A0A0C2GWV3_9BILA|nr:hypothetical protein ANCDUO_06146 [Ancylostoma duodenale]
MLITSVAELSRLRQMIRQLIPESGLRSGRGYTGNCIKPDPFEYISANDYTSFRENSLVRQEKHLITVKCDCSDSICGDECACRQMNDQFTPCTIMV